MYNLEMEVLIMTRNKTRNLTPVSFRLDTEVVADLEDYSEKTMIPKTRIVETAIKEFLIKHKSTGDL